MNKIGKEQWVKIRVSEELPLEVFWSYFDDFYPNKATFEVFSTKFVPWIIKASRVPHPNSQHQPVLFSMESNIKKMFDYFDKKFKIGEQDE